MDSPITVMVETAAGVLVRRIESASPLRGDLPRGTAAEEATRGAASVWGLPDFVFRPTVIPVGSGSREVGDGLLIVGSLGVAVQVKAREGAVRDAERERRWIDKHVARGLRQAHGTIRTLRAAPHEMTNGRGRVIELDGRALRWVAVVVVDDPEVPAGIVPPVDGQPNPSVVLLRRDWEFLFDQLKSTYAVTRYLERVAGDPLELGTEVMRYFQLAQADERTPSGPADVRGIGPAAQQVSWPLLPYTAAAEEDAAPQTLVRIIFEDVARGVAPSVSEAERLRVLAALDGLPVQTRALVGEFLLEGMDAVTSAPEGMTDWRQRRVVGAAEGGHSVQLAFGVCSEEHSEMIQDVFSWWVQLRHHEVYEARMTDGGSFTTIGVVLTPRTDGVRPWDTTMIAATGDLGLDEETLAQFREVWPHSDAA